jgi:hypothetical protein
MGEEKRRVIGIRYILGWVFGVLFILAGAVSLIDSVIGGIFVISGALLIFPPFGKFLEKRYNIVLSGWLKFIGFLILLGIGSSMLPQPEMMYTGKPEALPVQTVLYSHIREASFLNN